MKTYYITSYCFASSTFHLILFPSCTQYCISLILLHVNRVPCFFFFALFKKFSFWVDKSLFNQSLIDKTFRLFVIFCFLQKIKYHMSTLHPVIYWNESPEVGPTRPLPVSPPCSIHPLPHPQFKVFSFPLSGSGFGPPRMLFLLFGILFPGHFVAHVAGVSLIDPWANFLHPLHSLSTHS